MRVILTTCLLVFFQNCIVNAQSLSDIVESVSKDGIMEMVSELSGEKAATVSGSEIMIRHRVSAEGNNDAADYIHQKLSSLGLQTEAINYSAGGRNIVATQLGLENPDQIILICAHYDSTDDHGADDNASGTVAVIETARLLSQYSFKYTVIYALWDEEEIGLVGARNYAQKAKSNGLNIKAVLNMDMMAYDSNDDGQYDIDVRNISNSYEIRDALIKAVADHELDLKEKVVDPGTPNSDHAVFWDQGYSAVLLGEAWSVDDITPGYHSDSDKLGLFNIDYYWNMVKLCVAYTSTRAGLITTEVAEVVNQNQVLIEPNPGSGIFNIDLGKSIEANYELINSSGQVLRKEKIVGQTFQVDLTAFPSSHYYIRLRNVGNEISVLKIVKN